MFAVLQLQRDAVTALRQVPGPLVSGAVASAAAAERQHLQEQQQQQSFGTSQQQQLLQPRCEHGDSTCSSVSSSCCSCVGRTPSATAASTAHVALQLSRWGYRVIVRKVLHSKAYWTKSMDNTFIVALDTSSGSHVEYVVDPHFRETFNVGVMSSNYRWAQRDLGSCCLLLLDVASFNVLVAVAAASEGRSRSGQEYEQLHVAQGTDQHLAQQRLGMSASSSALNCMLALQPCQQEVREQC
jgi:hypothetical protein